jgi:hypothetical protein
MNAEPRNRAEAGVAVACAAVGASADSRPAADAASPSAGAVYASALATTVCILASLWVGIKYAPLQVDGTWAAYPAISLMLRGSAVEDFEPLGELSKKEGFKVKFGHFDNRSLRLYPMRLWFTLFGTSMLSCRMYSLIEYMLLLTVFWGMARTFAERRETAFLLTCFFASNSALIGQLEDLRPDMFLTAVSLAGFIALWRFRIHRGMGFHIGHLMLIAAIFSWHTSCLNLSAILAFVLIDVALNSRSFRNLSPGLAWAFALAVIYLFKRHFLDWAFGPISNEVDNALVQLKEMWGNGFYSLLLKEVGRWRAFSGLSNLPAVLAFWAGFWFVLCCCRAKNMEYKYGLIAGVAIGSAAIALLDPHHTANHLFALVPFLYLLVAAAIERLPCRKARYRSYALAALVFLSATLSLTLSARKAYAYLASGYTNQAAAELVSRYLDSCDGCTVVGPTGLFSLLDLTKNVTVLDYRSKDRVDALSLRNDMYLFLDRDYAGHGFLDLLKAKYPEIRLEQLDSLGTPHSAYLSVYRIVSLHS